MSSIDDYDKARIKETSDEIKVNGSEPKHPSEVYAPIMEYGFDSPPELHSLIEHMWTVLKKDEMKVFLRPVVVSAFNKRNDSREIDVSPFNYQF